MPKKDQTPAILLTAILFIAFCLALGHWDVAIESVVGFAVLLWLYRRASSNQ